MNIIEKLISNHKSYTISKDFIYQQNKTVCLPFLALKQLYPRRKKRKKIKEDNDFFRL